MNNEKISFEKVLFFLVCWLFGFILLKASAQYIHMTSPLENNLLPLGLLATGLLLILLPFYRPINIPKILELEKDMRETKENLFNFKQEISTIFAAISSNLSATTLTRNHTTNNSVVVPVSELEKEIERIDRKLHIKAKGNINEISDKLTLDNEDSILALARAIIMIETLMRGLLSKRNAVPNAGREIEFLGLKNLLDLFQEKYPDYGYLANSVEYVRCICDAAIHGQHISNNQTEEALGLGARIIAQLRTIN